MTRTKMGKCLEEPNKPLKMYKTKELLLSYITIDSQKSQNVAELYFFLTLIRIVGI